MVNPRSSNSRAAEHGFTLVEMLVVITIIGLIMALVGPRVLNYLTDSKIKAAKIQIESFSNSLELFYLDTGRYPNSSEGLQALVRPEFAIQGWNGPYLRSSSIPKDPWGHPYAYRTPGQNRTYDILSFGSDGQEGGDGAAADITN